MNSGKKIENGREALTDTPLYQTVIYILYTTYWLTPCTLANAVDKGIPNTVQAITCTNHVSNTSAVHGQLVKHQLYVCILLYANGTTHCVLTARSDNNLYVPSHVTQWYEVCLCPVLYCVVDSNPYQLSCPGSSVARLESRVSWV